MRITACRREGNAPVTTLVGPLRDRAALLGALNSLYEPRLPLVLVEPVRTECDGN